MTRLRTGTTTLIRDLNRAAVLDLIGREGPIARAELARRLGLSKPTLTALAKEFLDEGLVQIVEQGPPRGGRPPILLGLVAAAAHALGIKVAPDHVVGVRADLEGTVLDRFEERFDPHAPDAIDVLAEQVRPWLHKPRSDPSTLLGVGIGLPGVVDSPRSGVVRSPMLGWNDVPLGATLAKCLQVPVVVENDVNTLAVAERLYGRGRTVENFLTVTIGRGVGLGIVVRGDVYRGMGGGAGEFGHVTVDPLGSRCDCGKRGCLETFVADPALVTRGVKERLLQPGQDVAALRALADAGDELARAIYADAGAQLGRAVAGLVNVLSPELVIVAGEGTAAWRHLRRRFERTLRKEIMEPLRNVTVQVDRWDDDKWALGAAALVLRAPFAAPLYTGADELIRERLARGTDVVAA